MDSNPQIAALLEALNNPSLPGIDLSLARMQQLLAALGHPEGRLPPVVHVAGTNGKGSTIAFLAAMLAAAGKRVHRYSSPHLVRFHERIVLAGEEIDDDLLLACLHKVRDAARDIPVTFFEATTAAAFLAFVERSADYLLLEVGLGGRLDATNMVAKPVVSVVTPIGIDHEEFLGTGITSIAREKAGIMKPGVPCFSAEQVPQALAVLQQQAAMLGVALRVVPPLSSYPQLGLCGQHQLQNAALAAAVARHLGINDAAIDAGLQSVRWPGRLQRLHRGALVDGLGPVWLDGGHNRHGAQALVQWLGEQARPRVALVGMMARKDARGYFEVLAPALDAVVCLPVPDAPDGYDEDVLAAQAQAAGIAQVAVASDLASAIALAQRYKPATVLVAGSLYLVGAVLKTHE